MPLPDVKMAIQDQPCSLERLLLVTSISEQRRPSKIVAIPRQIPLPRKQYDAPRASLLSPSKVWRANDSTYQCTLNVEALLLLHGVHTIVFFLYSVSQNTLRAKLPRRWYSTSRRTFMKLKKASIAAKMYFQTRPYLYCVSKYLPPRGKYHLILVRRHGYHRQKG